MKDGIFLTEQITHQQESPTKHDEAVNLQVAVRQEMPESSPEWDDDEESIVVEYSEDEVASFKSIFDMFDKAGEGQIEMSDFKSIMSSLNREEVEVERILEDFEYQGWEKLSFDEFIQLMQALERKILVAERQLKRQEETDSPRSAPNRERRKYGSMLPRTGVHFLPDSKVIDFLKLLDEYRRKCEADGKFSEAKRARQKFEDL